MPNVIHKYQLKAGGPPVAIPHLAKTLSVGYQSDVGIALWALVNTDNPPVPRQFIVYATGHSITEGPAFLEFIGTVFMGSLVWHVFEKHRHPTS